MIHLSCSNHQQRHSPNADQDVSLRTGECSDAHHSADYAIWWPDRANESMWLDGQTASQSTCIPASGGECGDPFHRDFVENRLWNNELFRFFNTEGTWRITRNSCSEYLKVHFYITKVQRNPPPIHLPIFECTAPHGSETARLILFPRMFISTWLTYWP